MPSKSKTRRKTKSKAINSADDFEKLLEQVDDNSQYSLRLYITGNTSRSAEAIANIRSLCEEFLPGRYNLEVIDIFQQPQEAASEQIIAAPTLVKKLPIPPRRIIGNLADRHKVLIGLNLQSGSPADSSSDETHWIKL